MIWAVLLPAGVLTGTIASMIGVGGGILMVPLLSFFFVATTQEAVGTSLAAVVVTSAFSSIAYGRRRVIEVRLGFWLMPAVMLGAWLGAWLTQFVSSGGLALAFAALLLYPAVMMIAGREPKEITRLLGGARAPSAGEPSPLKTAVIGLAAGVISGFFGVGGGVLMVPALHLFLEVGILEAVATSLFVMGPSALIGALQHAALGHTHLGLVFPLALGIVVGAQLGPRVASALPRVRLRQAFGVALAYAALNMAGKGLGGFGG